MADYILNVAEQTSKLDWAFPFQRTGAFPLDRSAVFSSLSDATKYAVGDGSDERGLGGTSYVGQIISVYDGSEVAAYVITAKRGLMKLAATTTSGDLATDVANLQGALDTLTATVNGLKTKVDALDDVDERIAAAIAAVDHLSRKIVDSVDDIDVNADDALKYIYMVPNGLTEDDDKYNEYMVVLVDEERKLEKVGDWAVDLSGYATTAALTSLEDIVKNKVDKVAGSRLVTEQEIEQWNKAEANYIKGVASGLKVSEEGTLSIEKVNVELVEGLAGKLDTKVNTDDVRLLTEEQKSKLEALDVDEGGAVSITADKISNLGEWLNENAAGTKGLSENNYDDTAKAKLEALLAIKSVKEDQLQVSEAGQLSIKAVSMDLVTGLTAWTDKITANANNINTLTEQLDAHVKNYNTLSSKVDDIDDRLTWKELE